MNGPAEREELPFESSGFESTDPQMQEFERAVAHAMRPVEVPAEMSAKFLALADETEQQRGHSGSGLKLIKLSNRWRMFSMPRIPQAKAWMGGAIAAVLAVGCFVGAHIHTEHERRVQAEHQFEAAERITDQALARTREQLQAQGIFLDQ